MNATTESDRPADSRPGSRRRRGLVILALVVAIGAIGWAAYWYTYGRWFENTEDAYVAGNIVQVNAEIAGTLVAVHVRETDSVVEGQLLAELDPADAQLAMDLAVADLANTVRQVQASYAQIERLRAQIAAREADLRRAREDLRRRASLAGGGAVSDEELNHAHEALGALEAAARATREELKAALAQTQGTTTATHPLVTRAAARVREAALALQRTRITAPLAGVIGHKNAQIGQRVAPGAPLLSVVPLDDLWVEANFKEVQLARMRIGQPVSLHSDLYGKDVTYDGRLRGISPGTGAAFALLPPQNASGNWIKIVQRVPVRIALDPDQLRRHPLRLGLSMHVKVDLHDDSGPILSAPAAEVSVTPPSSSRAEADPAVEALIALTIAENSDLAPPAG
jgi:membrane fusion protein (multidrug efflux system)